MEITLSKWQHVSFCKFSQYSSVLAFVSLAKKKKKKKTHTDYDALKSIS